MSFSDFRAKSYQGINRFLQKVAHLSLTLVPTNCEHNYRTLSADWVRTGVLQGIQQEIIRNHVEGITAELGVYQGDFARHINALFPNRELYLFDTFKGFDEKDVTTEKGKGFLPILKPNYPDFVDTSVDYVRSRMEHPENCRFFVGFFPDTTKEADEREYCFVSIDADLYAPIKAGLEYFYPRLSKGGYIMVHDFDHKDCPGARQAVMEYCQAHQIGYTKIPDSCGSVVLTK